MRDVKKIFLLSLSLVFVFILTACMDDVSDDGSTDAADGAEDVADVDAPEVSEGEEIVKIGYSGPLSGPGAQYGLNVLNGMEMAVNEINEDGFEVDGTTYKVELVALDDQYLPNETGTNVRRMVSEHGIAAVLIPHSGGIFASMEFNEQDDFIVLGYSSEPRMYEQGNELLVGISPKYSVWSQPFTEYMMENFGTKMAMLPTNSQYGKDWTDSIKPFWEEHGGEIVYETDIDFAQETDYFTTMTNALNTDPDVLFIGGPSEPTALVVQQAKDLGFEGGFMIMDQAKLEEMAEFFGGYELLEGSIAVEPLENGELDSTQNFVETYKDLYNEPYATSESGLNYQTVYSLIEAMKVAGTVEDTQAIMDAMNEGIQNLPDHAIALPLEGIAEDGALQWEFNASAVENGEVISIPVERDY